VNNKWIQDALVQSFVWDYVERRSSVSHEQYFFLDEFISWRDDNTLKDGGTQFSGKLVRVLGAVRPRKRLNTLPVDETKASGDENDARLDV
jgi:hypothetical protein